MTEPSEVSPEAFAVIEQVAQSRFLAAHDHLVRPDLYTPKQHAERNAALLKHRWNER